MLHGEMPPGRAGSGAPSFTAREISQSASPGQCTMPSRIVTEMSVQGLSMATVYKGAKGKPIVLIDGRVTGQMSATPVAIGARQLSDRGTASRRNSQKSERHRVLEDAPGCHVSAGRSPAVRIEETENSFRATAKPLKNPGAPACST